MFLRFGLALVLGYDGSADVSQGEGLARITALDVTTSRPLVRTTRSGAVRAEHRGVWSASPGPDQQDDQVLAQVDLSRCAQR